MNSEPVPGCWVGRGPGQLVRHEFRNLSCGASTGGDDWADSVLVDLLEQVMSLCSDLVQRGGEVLVEAVSNSSQGQMF